MYRMRLGLLAELATFGGIIAAHTFGLLPVSSTPYLLLLAWVSLRQRNETWSSLGVWLPENPMRAAALGTISGIALFFWGWLVQEPFFDTLTGSTQDLSQFDELEGNLGFLLIMLMLNWLLAAAGEETAYRGFLLRRLSQLFGGSRLGWTASLLVASATFGAAHLWQGVSGVLDAALMGLWYAGLYLWSGKNLLVPAVAHGINNTIGLCLLYAGVGL